jgi:hypothetical protein
MVKAIPVLGLFASKRLTTHSMTLGQLRRRNVCGNTRAKDTYNEALEAESDIGCVAVFTCGL